jgi:hypothetical protein
LLFTLPEATEPPVVAHRIGTALPRGAHALLLDGEAPSGILGYEHG